MSKSLAESSAELRTTIAEAWRDEVPPAAGESLCDTYDDEGIGAYFAGRTWQGHDVKALRYHSAGLSFLDPGPFRYYLPAYMLAVLDDADAADVICDHIPHSLSPQNLQRQWAPNYRSRIEGFTTAQRAAIAAFLDHCVEHVYGDRAEAEIIKDYLVRGIAPVVHSGVERLLAYHGTTGDPTTQEALSLSSTTVTDDELAALSALPSLQRLELGHTAITDAGLAHVAAAARQLESLELRNCTQITAAGYAHVARLPRLAELILSNAEPDDAALIALAPVRLRRLNITHARRITAVGFAALDVSALTRLDMFGVDLSDALAIRLGAAGVLEQITLGRITDAGACALARATSLRTLKLSDARELTTVGAAALATLPALAELDLGQFTGTLPPGFPALARIALLDTALHGPVPPLPALVELRIFSDRMPASLAGFAQSPHLVRAHLFSSSLEDRHVEELAGAPALASLTLAQGPLRGTALATLPRLVDLALDRLAELDEDQLAGLAAAPALARLRIEDCPLTDHGLAVVGRLQPLQTLVLERTAVTPAGLAALRAARPTLEIVVR